MIRLLNGISHRGDAENAEQIAEENTEGFVCLAFSAFFLRVLCVSAVKGESAELQ